MEGNRILDVLLIAPHQDDESIGCGGLLAKLQSAPHNVYVQHVFGGYTNVSGSKMNDAVNIRLSETEECSKILGFTLLENFGLLDRSYALIGQLIEFLIKLFHQIQPDIVLCPHLNESDYEHKVVHDACKEALWLSKIPGFKDSKFHNRKPTVLLCYEVWTPIQHPILYVDISKYIELKEKAINSHNSQMCNTDWVKGSLGINAYRGTTLQGTGYFEAFEMQRLTNEQVSVLNTLLNT